MIGSVSVLCHMKGSLFRKQPDLRVLNFVRFRHMKHKPKVLPTTFKAKAVTEREVNVMMITEELKRKKQMLNKKWSEKVDDMIFEDEAQQIQFCVTLRNNIASAMLHKDVRHKFVGRGINITKVRISAKDKIVKIYWISTNVNKEEETELILKENAASLGTIIEDICEIGKLPPLVFVPDSEYWSSIYLEKEFQSIAENEDKLNLPIRKLKTMEEVCSMQLRSQAIRVNRDVLIEEVMFKVERAKASHRLNTKPNAEDPPVQYEGYYNDKLNEQSLLVKKYLGSRTKQMIRSERVLHDAQQGDIL